MVEATEAETTLQVPVPIPASQPTTSGRVAFANLTVSQGLLPNVDLGGTLGFAFDLVSWLAVRADATIWFPTSSAPAGRGGEFWGWHRGWQPARR